MSSATVEESLAAEFAVFYEGVPGKKCLKGALDQDLQCIGEPFCAVIKDEGIGVGIRLREPDGGKVVALLCGTSQPQDFFSVYRAMKVIERVTDLYPSTLEIVMHGMRREVDPSGVNVLYLKQLLGPETYDEIMRMMPPDLEQTMAAVEKDVVLSPGSFVAEITAGTLEPTPFLRERFIDHPDSLKEMKRRALKVCEPLQPLLESFLQREGIKSRGTIERTLQGMIAAVCRGIRDPDLILGSGVLFQRMRGVREGMDVVGLSNAEVIEMVTRTLKAAVLDKVATYLASYYPVDRTTWSFWWRENKLPEDVRAKMRTKQQYVEILGKILKEWDTMKCVELTEPTVA